MPTLLSITLDVAACSEGIYLRWYHSRGGWHYRLVDTRYRGSLSVSNKDVLTTDRFSKISKVQRSTGKEISLKYTCGLIGLTAYEKDAITGMLEAERVQRYHLGFWQDIDISRNTFSIRQSGASLYDIAFDFELENYLDDVE